MLGIFPQKKVKPSTGASARGKTIAWVVKFPREISLKFASDMESTPASSTPAKSN